MQHWPDKFVVLSTTPDPSDPRLIGDAVVEFRGYRCRVDRAPLLEMAETAEAVVDQRARKRRLCVCASRRDPRDRYLKAPPARLLDDDECYDD